MAQAILVEKYVEDAQKLLSVLDKNQRDIAALFWFYSEGHERWRLMIASPKFDSLMTNAEDYRRIYDILYDDFNEIELERLQFSDLHLKPTFELMIQALAKEYTVTTQKPVWLESFVYNGSYIDGVVILRLNLPAEAHYG
jgi:hypothetical protein